MWRKGAHSEALQETTSETQLWRRRKAAGKRARTVGGRPPDRFLYSVGCKHVGRYDYVRLSLDVGSEKELLFLVDSGADISLLKSKRLIGAKEFEPQKKVRVRSVDGSVLETHEVSRLTFAKDLLRYPFAFSW